MDNTLFQPVERPQIARCDVPDALFATDNTYGIPLLDDRLQADYCHLPVMMWGATKRNQRMPGTWHFYTDDYRYEALWKDPSPVVNSQCVAAVEPNFTTSEQMPFSVALYQIYRKRWLARYWQTQGIKIWVDLNVAPQLRGINLLGVPPTWRAFMTRGYADRMLDTLREYQAAAQHTLSDDLQFAVYGGGIPVKIMCMQRGWIWVPEIQDIRKGKFCDV